MSADTELQAALKPLLDWLSRHFNAHRFLWLLAFASFLVAWNRGLALLYGLLALILSVLLLSWVMPWLSTRSIRVIREQQGPAQAGRGLRLRYRLKMRKPVYHLVLTEHFPCCTDEPVQRHVLPSAVGGSSFVAEVPCDLRGVFHLNDIRIGSGWPFGFVNHSRRYHTEPSRLVIMPRTFSIESIPTLRSDIPSIDGYNQTAQQDMQHEFAGVREYRFGDSLKHIHWMASARHRMLVVREYESHDRPHLLVVLDARRQADTGEAPCSSFEYSVSIAASLIEYAIERQLGLHLVAAGSNPLEISIAPGSRNSHDYIEQLAWLRADDDTPYPQMVSQALVKYGAINTLVTFRNQSELPPLPASNAGHLDIVFEDKSFLFPVGRYRQGWQAAGAAVKTLYINRNSDLQELFKA